MLLVALVLFAAEPKVYTGSIGKNLRVIVELSTDGANVSGRYVYAKHGKDIALNGTKNATGVTLLEGPAGASTGTWTLDASGRKGTWSAPGAKKKIPIALSEERTTFDALLAEAAACSVDLHNENDIQRLKTLPRSVSCDESTDCMKAERNLTVHGGRFLETSQSYDGYCGGAYPMNNESETNYYDLDSGKYITVEQLFTDETTAETMDALFVRDAALVAKARANQKEGEDYDCSDAAGSGFRIDTARGVLELNTNYPHVTAVCAPFPQREARFQKLARYLSPLGQALIRAVQKR